jgi:hypothetical protein
MTGSNDHLPDLDDVLRRLRSQLYEAETFLADYEWGVRHWGDRVKTIQQRIARVSRPETTP